MVLCLLVSIRFQVLFHSPPGVLFTFPSRYYSLSVTWSYLAFGMVPCLPSGFLVSRRTPDTAALVMVSPTGLSPSSVGFPTVFGYLARSFLRSLPRTYFYMRFGLLRFRSPLLSESFLLSFPPGTKMFQFPGFPSCTYVFSNGNATLLALSSLIRISADLKIFAPPRSFSQLVTSFFGAMYQGILREPFVA